jgi:hypothetical protein
MARQTETSHTEQQSNIQQTSTPPSRPPRARDNQLIVFDSALTTNRGANLQSFTSNERVYLDMSHLSARFSHSTPNSLNFESAIEPSHL